MTQIKQRLIARWLLAGPLTIITAIAAMAAMPVWFPEGAAGINHLAFTLILFPAIWAVAFFYAVLEENLWRAGAVLCVVLAANTALALSSGGWA